MDSTRLERLLRVTIKVLAFVVSLIFGKKSSIANGVDIRQDNRENKPMVDKINEEIRGKLKK